MSPRWMTEGDNGEVERMRHEPTELAARFLAGHMRRTERWRFERHLVECADCWRQVQQGRTGRSAVESLRVVAPPSVRERVRAITEFVAGDDAAMVVARHRRRPAKPLLLVAAAMVAAVVVGVLTTGEDSHAEAAVVEVSAAYSDAQSWAASDETPPVRKLPGLHWVDTRATTIEGDRVLGDIYTGRDGASILVVRRDGMFATPPDAEVVPGGDWMTEVDGVTIICMLPPRSWLVVGDDPSTVTEAARTLTAMPG